PKLRRILARAEPRELALVVRRLDRVLAVRALGQLADRLRAHDQGPLAGAEQVRVLRRLVTGAVPDDVLLPRPRLALRVLVPVGRLAREADDDLVRPPVTVDVVRPAEHALAVARQAVAVVALLLGRLVEVVDAADRVHLPVRGLVPEVADEDVRLAVPVHVGAGDALR